MIRKEDLPPEYQKQVEDKLSDKVETSAVEPKQGEPSKHEIKKEKELQKLCENYLCHRGYMRLVAEAIIIQSTAPKGSLDGPKGYFGHWFNNRRNPFILDLLILSPSGHYLMVELKTSKKYQPGQKELVAQGYGQFAYSFEQFVEILNKWEDENGST